MKFYEKINYLADYQHNTFKSDKISKNVLSGNGKSCIFAVPKTDVSVAQQVEHIPFKDGVLGSNPSWNTESQLMVGSFFYLLHFLPEFSFFVFLQIK